MAKKVKSGKKRQISPVVPSKFDRLLATAMLLLQEQDYNGAIDTGQRLLSYLPQRSPQRMNVLTILGSAQGMLQNYPAAFAAFNEGLEIEPFNADFLYNHGLACRFTMRTGRSYKDFVLAQEWNKDPLIAKQIEKELKFSRKFMEEGLRLRGPDFTLEQLIEQEDLFQRGIASLGAQHWQEAEEAFRATIVMGDCLPQPWGNLASSLLMQERFDEAEEAWKHALVIDHTYDLAKQNLKLLPEFRKNGPPRNPGMRDPLKGGKGWSMFNPDDVVDE